MNIVREAVTTVSALILASLYGALVVVGVASWRRTGSVRRGIFPGEGRDGSPSRAGAATSAATYLPALTGLDLSILGVAGGSSAHRIVLFLVVLATGAAVGFLGIVGRVAAIRVGPRGLCVTYAFRPRFELSWIDCRRLAPPRTPLGGWRVGGTTGSRTLMPSDLLGREGVLAQIIRRSGLRFDGRRWVRSAPTPQAQRTVRVPVIWVGWNSQWKK